jgi:hypothetical protein
MDGVQHGTQVIADGKREGSPPQDWGDLSSRAAMNQREAVKLSGLDLTHAALEVLARIAFKRPISQEEIDRFSTPISGAGANVGI